MAWQSYQYSKRLSNGYVARQEYARGRGKASRYALEI
jgi:hypothetical protein